MDRSKYIPDLKIRNPKIGDLPIHLANYITDVARVNFAEFIPDFPFFNLYGANSHISKDYVGSTVFELYHRSGTIMADEQDDAEMLSLYRKIYEINPYPTFDEIDRTLAGKGMGFDAFTYVGKLTGDKISFLHAKEVLTGYINKYVLPEVTERNKSRVLKAIPIPPNYDVTKILRNTYVIESEALMIQGTAFHLKGVGLVTCEHCISNDTGLADDIMIFHPFNILTKYKAMRNKGNNVIDLATLDSDIGLKDGLDIGDSDTLKVMDHLATCGYPNYRLGDTGVFSPGIAVGFRPVSGINRILINTPLIAGMSGGPIIDRNNKVVGVAVTGADRMENANNTENHGVIPISALHLL